MKRKIFIQNDPLYELFVFLFIAIGSAAIWLFVNTLVRGPYASYLRIFEFGGSILGFVESIIVSIIGLSICIYAVISFESFIIFMDDNKVWMNTEINFEKDKIQFKVSAEYKHIIDIQVFDSTRNSKGRTMTTNRAFAPKKYIGLVLDNGQEQWFYVSHFLDTTVIVIVNEIYNRIISCNPLYEGSKPDEVFGKYYSMTNSKKRKNKNRDK